MTSMTRSSSTSTDQKQRGDVSHRVEPQQAPPVVGEPHVAVVRPGAAHERGEPPGTMPACRKIQPGQLRRVTARRERDGAIARIADHQAVGRAVEAMQGGPGAAQQRDARLALRDEEPAAADAHRVEHRCGPARLDGRSDGVVPFDPRGATGSARARKIRLQRVVVGGIDQRAHRVRRDRGHVGAGARQQPPRAQSREALGSWSGRHVGQRLNQGSPPPGGALLLRRHPDLRQRPRLQPPLGHQRCLIRQQPRSLGFVGGEAELDPAEHEVLRLHDLPDDLDGVGIAPAPGERVRPEPSKLARDVGVWLSSRAMASWKAPRSRAMRTARSRSPARNQARTTSPGAQPRASASLAARRYSPFRSRYATAPSSSCNSSARTKAASWCRPCASSCSKVRR